MTNVNNNKNHIKVLFAVQFLTLALLVGLLSASFSYAVSFATMICHELYAFSRILMFIYIPISFVIITYLLKRYFPYSDGSGLPQGYAVDVMPDEQLKNTYSIKSAIGKVILTFMGIASGASLGKEGPTIQICSSIFAQMRNITDAQRKLLIKLGSGVGVAAAFNTPLGGMVFAVEEYIRQINARISTLLVGGTLCAVFVSNVIIGYNPYFGYIDPKLLQHQANIIFSVFFIAVLCGLLGALFTKIIVFVSVDDKYKFNQWRRKYYLINALFLGIIVAFIGYLTGGLSFGNGSDTTKAFLDIGNEAPWYYALGKFSGVVASVGAGVPGGYFSTALSIGAGIGDLIHHFFNGIPLAQFYLLGMVGFLSAITQSPITAAVMIVEMSNSSEFCLPILFASFIASLISEQFGDSVYHQQVLKYIPVRDYRKTL